jgi:phage terminase large subunit GpA-like protein
MTVAELAYASSFKAGLKPTDFISVSEWADKDRKIPKAGGAKEPGQWRTSRFPFLREIMDNLSPFSGIPITIVMAGTQVGKTECGHNFFGHTVHIAPAPMLLLLPTIEVAKRRAKTKIKHTIMDTPVLNERIAPIRERDSENTTLFRTFPGGSLIISGANSAASLRDISIKNLHLDEVDAYDMDLEKEGDTISLAFKRADSFGDEKRILITSTPTITEHSKIEREFSNSDQRHFYVPCPYCGHMQYLRWKDGRWNGDGEFRLIFEYDDKHQLKGPVQYK